MNHFVRVITISKTKIQFIKARAHKLRRNLLNAITTSKLERTMPQLKVTLEDEQQQFEAEVASIEKQWQTPRQKHLKRQVASWVLIYGELCVTEK